MAGLVQPYRGDNGSAFFFRLPSRAKSAMAEILVSDLCECRPPLLIGGLFRDVPPWTTRDHVSGYFRLFRLFCALFFFIACHCFCAGGFSLARARPCIVIRAHFPLQIDCIFPEKFSVGVWAALSRRRARRDHRWRWSYILKDDTPRG